MKIKYATNTRATKIKYATNTRAMKIKYATNTHTTKIKYATNTRAMKIKYAANTHTTKIKYATSTRAMKIKYATFRRTMEIKYVAGKTTPLFVTRDHFLRVKIFHFFEPKCPKSAVSNEPNVPWGEYFFRIHYSSSLAFFFLPFVAQKILQNLIFSPRLFFLPTKKNLKIDVITLNRTQAHTLTFCFFLCQNEPREYTSTLE